MARMMLILQLMMTMMFLSLCVDAEQELCGEEQDYSACLATDASNDKLVDEEILLISSIVDLEQYPIHQRGEAYIKLVKDCQRQLKAVGSVDLAGFIRPDVIKKMAMEVDNLPSFNRLNLVSPYGAAIDDEPAKVNFSSAEAEADRQPH